MAYKIYLSPRAQEEIENAIDYYAQNSSDAPSKFISSLDDAYNSLMSMPFYEVYYKNIRAFKLNKFPYSLYFVVNEESKAIKILSCFHQKLSPKKRPK
jgi:plasmid stabilization system protein ParE